MALFETEIQAYNGEASIRELPPASIRLLATPPMVEGLSYRQAGGVIGISASQVHAVEHGAEVRLA